MTARRSKLVIPSAHRLITSLRDIGYDFPTAVADLVDNSIEAEATEIRIDVTFNGEDSELRIFDNGYGMTLERLEEAMRFGSERDYDHNQDLGKFGLGLKTASISQCQRLSVITRADIENNEIYGYAWDLDHIANTNRWEILRINKRSLKKLHRGYLNDKTGTVVVWQRLDRILGYSNPDSRSAKNRLLSMTRNLEEHLAMVFHRFISGEAPERKVSIFLNNNEVEPWDPFVRDEDGTEKLDPIHIGFEHNGNPGRITLLPFVLPHQNDFSSPDAFDRASGPRKWNRQQGFYIYRSNRMIQSGGWSWLRTYDEHIKLARIAMLFTPDVDDAFGVNISKMSVSLPAQIRDEVREAILPVIKRANIRYRGTSSKNDQGGSPRVGKSPGSEVITLINQKAGDGGSSTITISPNGSELNLKKKYKLDELLKILYENATEAETTILNQLIHRIVITPGRKNEFK